MTIKYVNYPNGYIKVVELMRQKLPRPKLKTTAVVTGWGEILPIKSYEW